MAVLPPKDSPIWNQLEDAVADERWPRPPRPLFLFAYRKNDPASRRAFAKLVITLRQSLRLRVVIFFAIGVLSGMPGIVPGWRGGLGFILPAFAMIVVFLIEARKFDRYFRDYLDSRGPESLSPGVPVVNS